MKKFTVFVLVYLCVLTALTGHPAAAASVQVAYCTGWAGVGPSPTLTLNVQGQNVEGKSSGYFGVGAQTWSVLGYCASVLVTQDAAGSHGEITAYCTYKSAVQSNVQSVVIFHLQQTSALSQVGVRVTDYKTGRVIVSDTDASGNPIWYPMLKGGMTLSGGTSAFSPSVMSLKMTRHTGRKK